MDPIETIRLLYIEDNIQHAEMIIDMLSVSKCIKFIVEHRANLKDSIEYLTSIHCDIDIVLLDLMLPNSQGVDTFKQVYNVCTSVPVVIISAHEDIAYECISLGAQDYLVKPDISPSLISRSIKYAIERKRNRINLEKEQKRFKLLSEASFEGITIAKDGIFLDANERFAQMVGSTVNEIIGMKVTEFVAPDYEELVLSKIKGRYERAYEHIAQRKDGSLFPVEIHGRSLPDGLRLTAVRDMSKYKEAENKYKDLVEVTNAGIYEIDFINNKFTYVNDVMCKMTGWSREELMSMGPTDMLTERSLTDWIKRWEALNRGEYIDKTFEYEAKMKNGSIIWTLVTAEFQEDEEGMVIGARVVAINITNAKMIEEKAKKTEELIFNQLEKRIYEWREEISLKTTAHEDKLREISLDINSMSRSEVQ